MLSQNKFIDSCDMVRTYVNEHTELETKIQHVQKVMKNDLNMRFRKVTKAPLYLNSVRNMILRQQSAIKILEALEEGKILINMDETWLNEFDFRRMKWREYGTENISSI